MTRYLPFAMIADRCQANICAQDTTSRLKNLGEKSTATCSVDESPFLYSKINTFYQNDNHQVQIVSHLSARTSTRANT
jgi:hypothetical protein